MHPAHLQLWHRTLGVACFTLAMLAGFGCASAQTAQEIKVSLNGMQESPPVETKASGSGSFVIGNDRTISGSVTTANVAGTMAHIHTGAVGKNGPSVVPLQQKSATEWVVAPGTKLSDAQYAAYKAGELYVNVHSTTHPDGEIRAQILPPEPTRASLD